jgi:hypothetical protein
VRTTYDLVFQPDVRRALSVGHEPQLTAAKLEDALPGCSVVEPIEDQWGPRRVHLRHDRPTPEQALQEIASAAPQLGFSIGNAMVNKWAGDAGERVARWLLGDGAVDAAAANPLDGLLVYIVGTLVRAVVREEEQKLEAQYEAQHLYFGGWTLREIPQQQPSERSLAPSLWPV